jgi:hypothetical protein
MKVNVHLLVMLKDTEEMSLYGIVSKKNYKIILYAYACIHYYLINVHLL